MRFGDYEVKRCGFTNYNLEENDNTTNRKEDKKPGIIPIGEKKDVKSLDEPVVGYSLEKQSDDNDKKIKTDDDDNEQTKQTANDDDDYSDLRDHDVDTNLRPHKIKTISKHKSSRISDALNNVIYDDINNDDGDDSASDFIKAYEMTEDENEASHIYDEVPDNLNLYGNATAEFSKYKLEQPNENDITQNTKAYKLDFGGSYGKKSKIGHTQLLFYASGSKTFDKTREHVKEQSLQNQETVKNENPNNDTTLNTNTEIVNYNPKDLIEKNTTSDIKLFVGGKHEFNNKDSMELGALYYKDGSEESSTTYITAKYVSNKYDAYIQGEAKIYSDNGTGDMTKNPGQGKTNVVTNIKFGLNPKITEVDVDNSNGNKAVNTKSDKAESSKTPETTELKEENNTNNSNKEITGKKWETISNPFITSQSLNGNPEQGLGYEQFFKKKDQNSTLILGYFSKFSIENTNDGNQKSQNYNLTVGGNFKYSTKLGNGTFESIVKLRNRYTIAKQNIYTITGNASYTTGNLNAAVNANFINVPDAKYVEVYGSIDYDITDRLNVSATASYTNWKSPEERIKGGSIMVGLKGQF